MAPKVSVLIPTYNYAAYLPEAIESVLSQSYTDFELLVIDDRSADETAGILAGYAKGDPRISFRVNPRNLGMVENWNLCLRLAAGEYVKYLFADDLLCSPEALRLMVEALDENPAAALVASARRIIDSQGRSSAVLAHFPDSECIEGSRVINHCLRHQKNRIGEPTAVMFRRYLAAEGFDPRFGQIVDLEFWFRLLEKGGLAYINRPLAAFRRHEVQQTARNRRNAALLLDDTERLLTQYVLSDAKHYLQLTRFRKSYLVYDYSYQVWKLYRQKMLRRAEAKGRIAAGCGWGRFFWGYPFYKLLKPLNKLLLRMENVFS